MLRGQAEVCATGRGELDLADVDAIRRVVRDIKPQVIINAAAYTAVDRAEADEQMATAVNGIAPGVLGEEAKRLGTHLVHYSTDYVFDGTKGSPYREEDEPKPLSAYGRGKLAGERAIQQCGCRYLILRTSWVYGPRGKNFYRTIAAKAAKGDALRVVNDQHGVPTTSRFLAEKTTALLHAGATGLLHLVPSGEATWFEFARAIVREVGSRSEVSPIHSSEFPAAARRPAYSVLDNRKVVALLDEPMPHWEALLRAVARD